MNSTGKAGKKPVSKKISDAPKSMADIFEQFGITDEVLISRMKELALDDPDGNGAMLRYLHSLQSKPTDRLQDVKLRQMEERTERLHLQNAEKRGELISRAIATTYINDFYNAQTAILLPTGAKIIDRLAAIAKVEDISVKLKMQETLDDEHYAFLETIEKTANSFIKRYGEGKVEPPSKRQMPKAKKKR
ncbi:hypothetical protein LQZ19_05255 [Treponema primitia]|uniref:hypothetical protein n=1 Tax=Treponema primitia TaxID=88058 RepID=UPI003980477E